MKQVQVVVTVDKATGETAVQVNGMTGPGCIKLTQAIVDALKDPSKAVNIKQCAEYYVGEKRVVGQAPRMTMLL